MEPNEHVQVPTSRTNHRTMSKPTGHQLTTRNEHWFPAAVLEDIVRFRRN
jgi:hypothetical protein